MGQHGTVLDILVTSRRDATAATRFFRKLLTRLRYVPRVLVTDKLASHGVARRRLIPGPGGAQRFRSAFSAMSPHFRPYRHRLHTDGYRREMGIRFATWNQIVGLPTTA